MAAKLGKSESITIRENTPAKASFVTKQPAKQPAKAQEAAKTENVVLSEKKKPAAMPVFLNLAKIEEVMNAINKRFLGM